MKIGSRIIKEQNIQLNDSETFGCNYKGCSIYVERRCVKTENLPEYTVLVWAKDGSLIVEDRTNRVSIHDAIIYAFEKALL